MKSDIQNGKRVEKIVLSEQEKKYYTDLEKQIFDIINKLMDLKLCGFELTTGNGWKITFKNKKFAKQIGVPI